MPSNSSENIQMVREAVRVQHHNPNTEAFKNAHHFLQTFRSSPDCLNFSMLLSSTQENDETRHFALQCINHIINAHWKSFTPQQIEALKESSFKFISDENGTLINEKNFIKEKNVDILCSIVISGWPDSWPNFLKDLLALTSRSESALELVLRVLKNLRKETEINYKLPLQRRENIKQSIKSYNAEIFNLIEATLQCCSNRYDNFNLLEESKRLITRQLLDSALGCLAPNIQFPLEAIFKHEMVRYICGITANPLFFSKALECLILISNKKHVVPQNIDTQKYRNKLFCIWKSAIEVLEKLLSGKLAPEDCDDGLEQLMELFVHLVKNHKAITYKKNGKEDLKMKFIFLLSQAFSAKPKSPHVEILELWKALFEVKFFAGIKDSEKVVRGVFKACFEHIDKDVSEFETIDDLEEVRQSLQCVVISILRLILAMNRPLYLQLVEERLLFLSNLETSALNDKKNALGLTTKESKLYLLWENAIKSIRLPFWTDCFTQKMFNRVEGAKYKAKCEKILGILLRRKEDPLIEELILRVLPKFTPLFYVNIEAFRATIEVLFGTFGTFRVTLRVSSDVKLLREVISVRRAAIAALVTFSKCCKALLVPLYPVIEKQSGGVVAGSGNEEDLSGIYEFLLNVSEEKSLIGKRNELIKTTFRAAVEKFIAPQMTRFFEGNNFLELLKNTPEAIQARQILRVATNTINSLLRGVTKAKVSYATDNRLPTISVTLLNSFQNDETWRLVRTALPVAAAMSRAINAIHSPQLKRAIDEQSDLGVILFHPRALAFRQKQITGDFPRFLAFRRVHTWLSDIRDGCYSLLSLSCNLSDSFFTSDPNILMNAIFNGLQCIPIRGVKSIVEKIVSPFIIRCAAAVPQYLNTFLAPFTKHFLDIICTRLCQEWNVLAEENSKNTPSNEIGMEIENQDEVRWLTRSVSKLLFSLTLEIFLERQHEKKARLSNKPKKGQKAKRPNAFRLNKILFEFLLGNKEVFEPLLHLLLFFFRCPDSISRNNIYRFLLEVTHVVHGQEQFLQLISSIMIEALRVQSEVKEVDDSFVDFVSFTMFSLSKTNKNLPENVITLALPDFNKDDINFFIKAFLTKDRSLQKKKTRQFLLKLSGENSVELFYEKSGVQTDSVRKKGRNLNRRRSNASRSFVDPTNLGRLFETGDYSLV